MDKIMLLPAIVFEDKLNLYYNNIEVTSKYFSRDYIYPLFRSSLVSTINYMRNIFGDIKINDIVASSLSKGDNIINNIVIDEETLFEILEYTLYINIDNHIGDKYHHIKTTLEINDYELNNIINIIRTYCGEKYI